MLKIWVSTFILLISRIAAADFSTSELHLTFESYLLGEHQELNPSSLNPENKVLQLHEDSGLLDNRLEMKWLDEDTKVIVRPRWQITSNKDQTLGKMDLTDAFWEQPWSPKVSSTLGLQVYQWGPGEVFNPSNPFFRFNPQQQSFIYKEKGQVLTRINWSVDEQNNWVLIYEPISNREPFAMSEKEFKPQVALKYERSWQGTRNYLGAVGGMEHQNNPFLGQYAHFEFAEGMSLYLDAKETFERPTYQPFVSNFGHDMELYGTGSKDWSQLSLAGFRYEGDFDIRLEYIYNSSGYSKEEFAQAVESASNFLNPNYAQNLKRFLNSGLDFLTQHYLYASLRKSDPLNIKNLNFYIRSLLSLTDDSSLLQTEFDKSVSENIVVYGSYSETFGSKDSEFRLLFDSKIAAGLKATF